MLAPGSGRGGELPDLGEDRLHVEKGQSAALRPRVGDIDPGPLVPVGPRTAVEAAVGLSVARREPIGLAFAEHPIATL